MTGGATPSGGRLSRPSSGSTVAIQMEQPTLMPTKCFVRDLVDGQEVDAIFVVRARNRRQKRNGESFLKLQLGRRHGRGRGRRLGRRRRARAGLRQRRRGARAGSLLGRRALRRRRSPCAGCGAAAEGEYELADLTEAPPVPYRPDGRRPAVAGRDRPAPPPARAARQPDRPGHPDRPRLPRGAGGQVLPPGLPPRAARALPVGRAGRQRPGGHLPGHRPRRGGRRARCCTTSARSRPTRRATARSS